jgi:hypothetical protein
MGISWRQLRLQHLYHVDCDDAACSGVNVLRTNYERSHHVLGFPDAEDSFLKENRLNEKIPYGLADCYELLKPIERCACLRRAPYFEVDSIAMKIDLKNRQ